MADKMLIDGLIKFCDEKSKNIKLKAEPQVFVEIKQALEELKAIKQWKSDVMEGFCKYDASSFEEIVVNARAKAIDEFAKMLKEKYEEHNLDLCLRQNDYYSYANSCIQLENYIDKIAEQMEGSEESEPTENKEADTR